MMTILSMNKIIGKREINPLRRRNHSEQIVGITRTWMERDEPEQSGSYSNIVLHLFYLFHLGNYFTYFTYSFHLQLFTLICGLDQRNAVS